MKVEPLTAVASPKLRQLLSALLLLVQGGGGNGSNSSSASTSSNGAGSSSSNKVTAMVEMDRCLKLQSLVVQARHCLAPALRAGNRACQGRWVVSGGTLMARCDGVAALIDGKQT